MIAALVTGSLFKSAESRTSSKTGRPFVKATVRIKDGDESRFVNVVAFSETVQSELMRLADGDALSVQGPLKAEIYTASDGTANVSLSIVASNVPALRQPPKERKPRSARSVVGTWTAASGDPDDEIPFGGDA